MNGFEVQSVSQKKGKVLSRAEIRQPVPVKGGFTADDQIVVFEWLQSNEKLLGSFRVEIPVEVLFPGLVNNAHVHGVGVQVDAAVEFVRPIVKLHIMSFSEQAGFEPRTIEC